MGLLGSSGTSSSSSVELCTSNSRVSLSVPSPRSGAFVPGDTLHATVTLRGSSTYTNLSLKLIGQTHVTIMGHDRWQMGQMVNAGMGGGAGMLVTSIEHLPFIEQEIALTSSDNAIKQVSEKKRSKQQDETASGGMYEITLPRLGPGMIVPSLVHDLNDPAGASITWTLELVGKRHGVFKLNDKLSLELPVVFPLERAIPPNLPESEWPNATTTKALKFKSNDGTPLTVQGKLCVEPGRVRADELTLKFYLIPSASAASLDVFSTTPPKISVMLSKRSRTAPIGDPKMGKVMDWAGLRVTEVQLEQVVQDNSNSTKIYSAKIRIPNGCFEVQSPGLSISYVFIARVTCPALEGQLMYCNVPVFLPSTTSEFLDQPPQFDQEPSAGPSSHGNQLPSYSA